MPFSDVPEAARLWVHASDRPLTAQEAEALSQRLNEFLSGWQSHGRPVAGHAEIRDRRFVLLAAYLREDPSGDVSGCGIDASVHVLDAFAEEAGFGWQSSLPVLYRDADGAVQSAARPAFAALAEAGTVDAQTPVFDLSVDTVAALDRFEQPAGASWHADAFPLAGASAPA